LGRSSDPAFGYQFSITVAPEISPVHYARNLLVGIFLKETNADFLWFIDNDMMPDESSLEILNTDADIASGRCLATRPSEHGIDLAVTAFSTRNPATGEFQTT
jgi:hypothetical protein